MNAFVITHSTSFEPRAEAVGQWLQAQGVQVTWIYSDFHHIQNKTLFRKEPNHIYLHLRPYQKNLSLRRLQSIRQFAADVETYLAGKQSDLLYFLVPANSFVPVAERLRARTGAKVVLDLCDLWPDSLPIKHVQGLPPLRVWKNLRDEHLAAADLVFTECAYYQELVPVPEGRTQTLTWFAEEPPTVTRTVPEDGRLHIAYLGTINYLLDRAMICETLQALLEKTPVTMHVIGEGETKEEFLEELRETGAEVFDYGAVYDPEKKVEILARCSCAFNMMVPEVRVGLTMKSLDYLAHGLLLLNNISGDTAQFVEEKKVGVNIARGDVSASVPAILDLIQDKEAPERVRALFAERFTRARFEATLAQNLGPLLQGSVCAISVAMTAKNGEAYLEEQLSSIQNQLGEQDEIVVSVDPSIDRTLEILCEAASQDARIRVIEGPGQGIVKNMEHALRACRGRWIFLADQDDLWLEGKVEKVLALLQEHMLVLHDAKIVDADLQEIAPSFMQWRHSRKGVWQNLWKNSYIGCCMAFRAVLLEKALPFPEDLPMHDQWLGLMAERCGSVKLLRTPLVLYRRHAGTATDDRHKSTAQMLRWRTSLARELAKRIQEKNA